MKAGARQPTSPAELPVLRGERVLLRQPVAEQDLAARLEVPPDPELHRMYGVWYGDIQMSILEHEFRAQLWASRA